MEIKRKKIIFASLFSFFIATQIFAFEKPIVTNIKAEYASGRKINVLWTLPKDLEFPITKIVIYRDIKPISTAEDLKKATLLETLEGYISGYTDTVDDFRDYFYAVLTYTDRLNDFIMPSINATVNGAKIKPKETKTEKPKTKTEEKVYPAGTLRETPLPYLDLVDGLTETENKISPETKNKAKNLGVTKKKEVEMLEPFFFEEDLISPEGGDEYLLFQILSQYFVKRNYNDSIKQLTRLTGTKISEDTENRAIFYLGEAYYFTGDFENAVRTFLKVQEKFPVQTKKWITSSLDLLEL